ncbi:MAG: hypothetical protein Q8P22_00115 [Chloroflexota bacterium]|nr:hypothetical protein [Chloroflexota bacterium]
MKQWLTPKMPTHSRSAKVPGATRTNTSVSLRNVPEASTGNGAYAGFYNEERPH